MKKKLIFFLTLSHGAILVIGVGLGIYLLPILTAPKPSSLKAIEKIENNALYKAEFIKNLKGSDLFHWGEAKVTVTESKITVNGKIAPGPDYKLYLTNQFVETEKEFLSIKQSAQFVGDIKTFRNFIVRVPSQINIKNYNTIVIWCEAFNEFITATKYR
jgi:hypothetical protein|tara:strand:+ start:34 stop:510 length:477 start_codon:yes stop_codon:yes gene_type:complete